MWSPFSPRRHSGVLVLPMRRGSRAGAVAALVAVVCLLLCAGAAWLSGPQKAKAFNLVQFVSCKVMPAPANEIYQWANSDDIPFYFRSKSVSSPGAQPIDSILNKLLMVGSDDNFLKVNEQIMGFKLSDSQGADPADPGSDPQDVLNELVDALPDDVKEELGRDNLEHLRKSADFLKDLREKLESAGVETTTALNGGPVHTPYDRFGMSGLVFTRYNGEWKYVMVNACASDNDTPTDPQVGLMYEGRKVPDATWSSRLDSLDPRVVQSTQGFMRQWQMAAIDVLANWIFGITKTIVALTLAIIFLSFGNTAEIMGLNKLVGGEQGVFSAMFDGMFSPLIWVMMLITALYVAYQGLVQRQYRKSLGEFAMSILLLLGALVVQANPMFFVSAPNKVATAVQAVIITSVGGNVHNTKGMCSTEGGMEEVVNSPAVSLTQDSKSIMEQAAADVRSTIGCQFWESLVFLPWAQGQFGTSYNNLWVNDKIDSDDGEELGNDNGEMVGEASVPVGGGKYIHNWALLHVSTMTDAHAQIDRPQGASTSYTNGVANDWWRIVDALSNYDTEKGTEIVFHATTQNKASKEIQIEQQDLDNKPSEYWSYWVGNNMSSRMGVAVSSILTAIIGVGGPLAIALLASVYSVAIALAMSFMPVVLLFGIWPGRGRGVLKSWLELVIGLVMKRIAIGLVFVITLVAVSTMLSLSAELSYWKTLFGIIAVSIVMWKVKDKVISLLATVNLGGTFSQGTASQVGQRAKSIMKAPVAVGGKFAVSGMAGAAGAKRGGGSAGAGFVKGLGKETKNLAWRNAALRPVMQQYEISKRQTGQVSIKGEHCALCSAPLDYDNSGKFHGATLSDGSFVCQRCHDERIDPDSTAVTLDQHREKKQGEHQSMRNKKLLALKQRHEKFFNQTDPGREVSKRMDEVMDTIVHGAKDEEGGRKELTSEQKAALYDEMLLSARAQFERYERTKAEKDIPHIPQEALKYIDKNIFLHLLDEGKTDLAARMYADGIISSMREHIGREELDRMEKEYGNEE